MLNLINDATEWKCVSIYMCVLMSTRCLLQNKWTITHSIYQWYLFGVSHVEMKVCQRFKLRVKNIDSHENPRFGRISLSILLCLNYINIKYIFFGFQFF